MLKIAICDDSHKTVETYSKLISQCAKTNQLDIELSCFYSGESLLFHLMEAPEEMDIIYLDILMGKTDGMETARRLRENNCNAQIIFLTSCEDYVYDAFDVNAIQYMLKDEITAEKFERIFLRAAQAASHKEEEVFVCKFDTEKYVVPIRQISHFEIWKRIVTVHYGINQIARFYSSMEQLDMQFRQKGFIRVHRSYMVQLSYIYKFERQKLILKTGSVIPIGITYQQDLKRNFSDYISRCHIHSFYDTEGFCEERL